MRSGHRSFPAVGCDPSGPPDRPVTGGAGHPPKRRQRLGSLKSVAFVSMALARVKRAYP
jgi:hypothetical protein